MGSRRSILSERSFASQVPDERKDEFRALYPEVEHPVVCTHNRTGRRYLYVNRIFVDRFTDRSHEESIDLLDRLCRQTDYPEYQCRFRWEPGSIAFWDQPCRPALCEQRLLARRADHGTGQHHGKPPDRVNPAFRGRSPKACGHTSGQRGTQLSSCRQVGIGDIARHHQWRYYRPPV